MNKSFLIDEELEKKIRYLAYKAGSSQSYIIREAIKKYGEQNG